MELLGRRQIYGCGERGHADIWCTRRRCRVPGEMEEDDSLWRLIEKLGRAKTGPTSIFEAVFGQSASYISNLTDYTQE